MFAKRSRAFAGENGNMALRNIATARGRRHLEQEVTLNLQRAPQARQSRGGWRGREDVPKAHPNIKDSSQIVGMRTVLTNQDAGIQECGATSNSNGHATRDATEQTHAEVAPANHTKNEQSKSLTPHPSLTDNHPRHTTRQHLTTRAQENNFFPPSPLHPTRSQPLYSATFSAAMALSVFRLCRVTAAIVLGAAPLATGFVAPGLGGLRSRVGAPTQVNDDSACCGLVSEWGRESNAVLGTGGGGVRLQRKLKIDPVCFREVFPFVFIIICVMFPCPVSTHHVANASDNSSVRKGIYVSFHT